VLTLKVTNDALYLSYQAWGVVLLQQGCWQHYCSRDTLDT
jgi:hypothetical protein